MDKYRYNIDVGVSLIALDRYQIGQGCEETCDKNAFEEMTSISIPPGYTTLSEAFFNKWNSIIINLE